jgi:superfamily II DNA helicase RecQ
MKDQVDNLRNRTGVPSAAALNGLLTAPERGEVLTQTLQLKKHRFVRDPLLT